MDEINIFLNGQTKVSKAKTINDLLLQDKTFLNDGDRVEIVKSFKGG